MPTSGIEEAIDQIRRGRMVILVDDEDRENEGDLVIAAEKATPEAIHFMASFARGLICLTLAPELLDKLALAPMVRNNRAPLGTAFTNSIDVAGLKRPGISSADRADTIRAAIADGVKPTDFVSPGYVFPLGARRGGVLVRSGQTEGSVDLARLAGLKPAGVICEVMGPDGEMSRLPELLDFGSKHKIPVVSVADLIEYRMQKESFVHCVAQASLPTEYGKFEVLAYQSDLDDSTHIVLRMGKVEPHKPSLLRVHRADLLSDVFGVQLTRSRHKLDLAMRRIADEGDGILLYLRGDTRDNSLVDHLSRYCGTAPLGAAPTLVSGGDMGFRDFGIGAQILAHLGVRSLRVLTDHPIPFKGLSGFGLDIVEWVPLGSAS